MEADVTDKSDLDSKERLLIAAQGVFARKGFDGATVKDLADAAHVNVSLVSYYFGGKEGLYRACLESIGLDRLAAAERILKSPRSLEDLKARVRLFVEEFLHFHVKHKDTSAMLQRHCENEIRISMDIYKNTFVKSYTHLETFFKAGQEMGLISADVNVRAMTYLFFGALVSAVRFETVSKSFFDVSLEDPKWQEKVVDHLVEYMLRGFL